MNRLLLSLWLLGAVLFGANTLLYTNVILGWPQNQKKVDAGGSGKELARPKAVAESEERSGSWGEEDPVETAADDQPTIRLEPNPEPKASSVPPPDGGVEENVAGYAPPHAAAGTPSVAAPPLPAEQQAPPSSAAEPQQQQGQSAPPTPSQQADSELRFEEGGAEATPAAQVPQQGGGEWVKISPSGANVRSGPSSSASQLASVPPGMEVRVVSRAEGWVQVATANGSQTGWIYEGLVEPLDTQNQQAAPEGSTRTASGEERPQDRSEMMRVSGSTATVRSGPWDSAPMLFAFPEGRQVRVVSRQPGWVQVADGGSGATGWIAEKSLVPAGAPDQPQEAAEARLPGQENAEPLGQSAEPRDRSRRWGHRRGARLGGIFRRAFGRF